MYDKSLVIEILDQMIEAIEIVEERCSFVNQIENDLVVEQKGK